MTSTTFDKPEDYSEALEAAAISGDLERATALIADWRSKSDIESPTEEWLQVLAELAALNSRTAVLDFLLGHGATASSFLASVAAGSASPDVFTVLCEHGWRADVVDERVNVPVVLRAVANPPVLKWLLDYGADPNAISPHNSTALAFAANHATPAEVDLLIAHGARLEGSNALHGAVSREHTLDEERFEMMQHLLDLGIDVNAIKTRHVRPQRLPSRRGGRGPALHDAIRARKAGRVRWLLEHGADVSVRLEGRKTALEWAEEYKQDVIAGLLKQHGA